MSVEVKVNEWMELVGRKLFSIESVPKDVAVKMVYRCAKAVADKAENLEAAHAREVRRLREALEWIQERCSVIGSLTPCYPLASGLWDVCDKALAADQGETGGSDDKG